MSARSFWHLCKHARTHGHRRTASRCTGNSIQCGGRQKWGANIWTHLNSVFCFRFSLFSLTVMAMAIAAPSTEVVFSLSHLNWNIVLWFFTRKAKEMKKKNTHTKWWLKVKNGQRRRMGTSWGENESLFNVFNIDVWWPALSLHPSHCSCAMMRNSQLKPSFSSALLFILAHYWSFYWVSAPHVRQKATNKNAKMQFKAASEKKRKGDEEEKTLPEKRRRRKKRTHKTFAGKFFFSVCARHGSAFYLWWCVGDKGNEREQCAKRTHTYTHARKWIEVNAHSRSHAWIELLCRYPNNGAGMKIDSQQFRLALRSSAVVVPS